jgi:hypothetical protein
MGLVCIIAFFGSVSTYADWLICQKNGWWFALWLTVCVGSGYLATKGL